MKNSARPILVLVALLVITNIAFSQKMSDSNTPLHLLQPDYDTPYGKPEVKAIKTVLDQVYNYLNQTTPMQLIHKNSGEVITDYSKINENTVFRAGDFRLISCEWGVTYAGMLMASETSGDPKYADYTKGLFMHSWVKAMEEHPQFHWARANGWAVMTLVELLEVLPEDHEGYPQILDLLKRHIQGLCNHQSGQGFWHQLIDKYDSIGKNTQN